MPHRSSVPLNWRLQKSRYALAARRCECGSVFYPPVAACECGGVLEDVALSGFGAVESFTTIHAAPDGFESQAPYVIAIVRLDEGPAITAQIAEQPGDVAIGMRVRSVFRRLLASESGQIIYGTKFVKAE